MPLNQSDHLHEVSKTETPITVDCSGQGHNHAHVEKKTSAHKSEVNDHGGHGHGHNHNHNHAANLRAENKNSMLFVLGLTTAYMVLEVVTGYYTGSLALLADAGHMLGDIAALVLALVAIWFSSKPPTPDKTFGYYRSEILASFINGLALVGVSIFIMYEAYSRLSHPPDVVAMPVLIVACVGLIVNVVSLRILQKAASNSLNAKAAYLEILGDCLASVGVIISSCAIIFCKWNFADPLISALIAIAILPRTWALLKECTNILMEGTPGHIDLGALRQSLMAINGVVDVHDIHVWTITSGRDAMSGHVTINDLSGAEAVLANVTKIVNDQFGISHSTIQVEEVKCAASQADGCHKTN
ncbi:MAG: cation diffusion facilitator family transporter [Candidatus Obscuribacterales bacterium]|nr:cation diffusion facilitator family transporter [Candidatus Obscuribacterales bacterium]